jgi:hypothetical protein
MFFSITTGPALDKEDYVGLGLSGPLQAFQLNSCVGPFLLTS